MESPNSGIGIGIGVAIAAVIMLQVGTFGIAVYVACRNTATNCKWDEETSVQAAEESSTLNKGRLLVTENALVAEKNMAVERALAAEKALAVERALAAEKALAIEKALAAENAVLSVSDTQEHIVEVARNAIFNQEVYVDKIFTRWNFICAIRDINVRPPMSKEEYWRGPETTRHLNHRTMDTIYVDLKQFHKKLEPSRLLREIERTKEEEPRGTEGKGTTASL